ncbi:hypothetical protein ARMSODRAFT_951920 [Armillaria solidipes]|uniref:Uncharacterized protein n=1 Tax=Armillaria solidipes TaxID=1076256 RepID=A0A2H3BTX5_9AGAR|nr:hypothetical protein ARMSODRAFT_951920 [Armillaria solidipes]
MDSNPWGSDDLIDVNADDDDWSEIAVAFHDSVQSLIHVIGAFETAPTPKVVQPKPVRVSASGPGLSANGNSYRAYRMHI